jgi:acetylornithine deacetylase
VAARKGDRAIDRAALASVCAAVDEAELITFTREVARIPSVHGEEKAITEAFAARLEKLGLETDVLEVERDRANVLGWLRGAGGGRSLTLNGHLDTVVDCLGWTKDPYGGGLEDGKIYGHGISNMKASDAAMVYAAAALKRAGVRLQGDLLVALVVGECHGGVGTRDLMRRGIKTDAFVCGEPTYLNVLTVHAYSQYFRVDITGRTGHFGTQDHGVNAILKMQQLVRRLGPVHREIHPGGWLRFRDKPLYRGLPRYHIATIRGGLTHHFLEGPSNTPDFCSAVFNVRATPNKSIESTREDIERVLATMRREEPGMQYEVSIVREMRGFEATAKSLVVPAIVGAYRDVLGSAPRVGGIRPYMFMASDSGHMQAAGMRDGVLLGPGQFTSSVPDEHVEADKVIAAAKIYAATALRVCGLVP